MHDTALALGALFFDRYGRGARSCLDIGSMDINGSLRSVCPVDLAYTGVDLEAGPGVDVVTAQPSELPFPSESFDLVVSSSAFEHDGLFWLTFLEMLRVLEPGGVLYLNAPSNGHYHRHPLDCWRFYPDAGLALVQWAERSGVPCRLLESFISSRCQAEWNDCVIVVRKGPDETVPELFIADGCPHATNVRKLGLTGLVNFRPHTEDQVLLDHFSRLAEAPAQPVTEPETP